MNFPIPVTEECIFLSYCFTNRLALTKILRKIKSQVVSAKDDMKLEWGKTKRHNNICLPFIRYQIRTHGGYDQILSMDSKSPAP